MYKTKSGFTIVELLIVIVVIGILAAITIVAYNGIQTRGKNAATIAAANQAIKAVQAYVAANGAYPGAASSCLTATSGCYYGSAWSVNTTVNNNIATVASLPSSVADVSSTQKGVIYEYNPTFTYSGVTKPARIIYHLMGNAVNCSASNIANSGGGTMIPATSGYTYSDGTYTICFAVIDGPSA